ncbi:MAG: TonB-dependent receptor [Bacteroidales bacterium]
MKGWIIKIAMLLLNLPVVWGANSIQLKGKVIDAENHEPVIGATVYIDALASGTLTDMNGIFVIALPADSSPFSLEVRYLGYRTAKLAVVPPVKDLLIIRISPESYKLKEVNVMAESKSELSNYKIKKSALEYIQPSGISDILQLIPGNLLSDGSLSQNQQISMRQAGSDASTALGTSIVIDGTPQTNNANLQAFRGEATQHVKNVNGGIDLRTISTDHIEEVEVVNGIPSVKYGNLTSGAILIKSKAGVSPWTVRAKIDPLNKVVYTGKGFKLPGKTGNVNIGIDWAQARPDVRNELEKYNRLTSQMLYSNQIKRDNQLFSLRARLNFTNSMDRKKNDPNLLKKGEEVEATFSRWDFSTEGKWWINGTFMKSLSANVSASQTRDIFQNKRIVALNNQSAIPAEGIEGEHEGTYLPSEYISEYTIAGRPLLIFGNLISESFAKTGQWKHRITMGGEIDYEKNKGKGIIYDASLPPSPGSRKRSFDEIPGLGKWAVYVEDRINRQAGNHNLMLQGGFRLTGLFNADKSYTAGNRVYPEIRSNFKWELPSQKIGNNRFATFIEGGWGQHYKMPTLGYLYPEDTWHDIVALNYFSQTPENRLVIMNSQRRDRSNKELKPALNNKFEIGAGITSDDFLVTGKLFYEILNNGFVNNTVYEPVVYNKYDGLKNPVNGRPALSDFNMVSDTLIKSYSRPVNGDRVVKHGVEYRIIFPKIKPIHTTIKVNGAWFRTIYDTSTPVQYIPSYVINGKPYPYVGIYEWSQGNEKEQVNTTIWANTHLPAQRIIFSCALQIVWHTSNRTLPFSGKPLAYMDKSGNITPFTETDAADPVKSMLIRRFSDNYFTPTTTPVSMGLNLKATKEIGKHLTISCFVNRIWDYNPMYRTNLDTNSRKWSVPFFGTEIKLTI